MGGVAPCRRPIAPTPLGAQALELHQPGDPLAPMPLPLGPQLAVNPRTPVGPLAPRHGSPGWRPAGGFASVCARPLGRALEPGVEPRARHVEHAAHQPDRELGPVLRDARVPHRESFAKNAAALFKKSRSWRVISSLPRRSRRSSSLSELAEAAGVAVPSCRRHSRSCSGRSSELPGHLAHGPATRLEHPHRFHLELPTELSALPGHRTPPPPKMGDQVGVHQIGGGSHFDHQSTRTDAERPPFQPNSLLEVHVRSPRMPFSSPHLQREPATIPSHFVVTPSKYVRLPTPLCRVQYRNSGLTLRLLQVTIH